MTDKPPGPPADSPQAAAVQPLLEALRESLELLREAGAAPSSPALERLGHGTLLQQCLAMCSEASGAEPEPIRTLHQFACSGGTLVSKCVAAMPNVQLLSEVDPLFPGPVASGETPRFTPSDMPALLRASTRGASESLIAKVFQAELRIIHEHAMGSGLRLVLRDHAHTHYCRGQAVPSRPSLRELVREIAPVLSVVIVRHPADSFASLLNNGWVHFSPPDFETYCQRYNRFLDDHAELPVIRYEDLTEDASATMQRLCALLELPFLEEFASLFSVFRISGDSGRSGRNISLRPRRAEARELLSGINGSPAYGLLASRLGYGTADVPSDGGA